MDTILVDTLHKDLSFTGDLLIDGTFLLLPQTAPMTQELINAINKWEFSSVLCDGNLSLGGDIGVSKNGDDNSNENKEKIGVSLKKAIESSKSSNLGNSDQARMEMVESVFNEYMNYIEQVFTHYATHKEIDQNELSETIQELVMFVKDHKRYILRINPNPDDAGKNFLVIHSMRTTVLAIAIAQQLHLPLSKIIEVGVTSIIHEIGMLRVPPQLYMSTRSLTIGERATISKHTIFGYTIVKDLEFPLSIQLGVLEHHEKENGLGYPRKMMGDKISSNAKIIAVACSFEAISSPRGYKAERSTFDAMIELIQNKNHAYDDSVLKALLYTVSLYPIGTYVYLSNRKVAIICDTNPDNPKYPIAQLLTEKNKDGSPIQIPTDPSGTNIVRILSKTEVADIKKFLAEHKTEEVTVSEKAPEEPVEEKPAAPVQDEMYVENSASEEDFSSKHSEPSINSDGTENIDISMFN